MSLRPADEARATEASASEELAPRTRELLTAAWCSFLAASAATMLCFAFVDPAPLGATLFDIGALQSARLAIYTVGFFFFWALAAASALLTQWMTRSR